jgi:putative hydrolase of the HAD superfamily
MAANAAIIFDLDDTLYPERSYALSGFRAASQWAERALGVTDLEPEMTRLLDAGHLGKLFGMALAKSKPDHTADELAGLLDAYRTHEPEIQLFDDGAFALHHYGQNHPLGLITDGTLTMQAAKVRALGLAPRMREIVFTDALGPGRSYFKPHARAFEVMAAALGSDRPLVYVGDNPAKDFVAPNALGWTTVQVVRPGGIHDASRSVPGGTPKHVITSLHDLPAVLGF